MKDLTISKKVLVQDNIKNEFSFIIIFDDEGKLQTGINHFYVPKIKYFLSEQEEYNVDFIFKHFYKTYMDVKKTKCNLIIEKNNNDVNEKYYPKLIPFRKGTLFSKKLYSTRFNGHKMLKREQNKPIKKQSKHKLEHINYMIRHFNGLRNYKAYYLTFNGSFISYLENLIKSNDDDEGHLKKHYNDLLELLIEYTKQTGIDFDEYINNWAKKLMSESS